MPSYLNSVIAYKETLPKESMLYWLLDNEIAKQAHIVNKQMKES